MGLLIQPSMEVLDSRSPGAYVVGLVADKQGYGQSISDFIAYGGSLPMRAGAWLTSSQ